MITSRCEKLKTYRKTEIFFFLQLAIEPFTVYNQLGFTFSFIRETIDNQDKVPVPNGTVASLSRTRKIPV